MKKFNWDTYEAAILVDAYVKTKDDPVSREEKVKEVSQLLRNYYIQKGIEVDDTFRNETGISMQMQTIEYIYTNGKSGLPNGSRLFKYIVGQYLKNRRAFNITLEEAKRRIMPSMEETKNHFYDYTNKREFSAWLKTQGVDEGLVYDYSEAIGTLENAENDQEFAQIKLYGTEFLSEVRESVGLILHSSSFEELNGKNNNLYYYALEQYVLFVNMLAKNFPQTAMERINKDSGEDGISNGIENTNNCEFNGSEEQRDSSNEKLVTERAVDTQYGDGLGESGGNSKAVENKSHNRTEAGKTYAEQFKLSAYDYSHILVQDLDFSTRLSNILKRAGCETICDALMLPSTFMDDTKGAGRNTKQEFEDYLISLNNFNSRTEEFLDSNDNLGSIKTFEKEIADSYDKISETRKKVLVEGLIKVFACKAELTRNTLMSDISDGMTLDEFYSQKDFSLLDGEAKRSLLEFVRWCGFDINKDVEYIWERISTGGERNVTVLEMRANKKTLAEIGEKLGITRERVRQIEARATRLFLTNVNKTNLLLKIYAIRNQDMVLTPDELDEYFGEKAPVFLYLLRRIDNNALSFHYDSYLDVFIIGDDKMTDRVQQFVNDLPSSFDKKIKNEIIEAGISEYGLNQEIIEEALKEEYQISGRIYHKTRLTVKEIYENILEKYYPNGIYIYDDKEIHGFKERIRKEYGNIALPESDRTVGMAIARNAVLRDRGTYVKKKEKYLSKSLKKSIESYIKKSKSNVIMYSSIFVEFQEELAQEGIDNRYYLQGVLKHYFDDVFVLKKDWICKSQNATNITDEIVRYIKKSESPVLKEEIKKAFPGVSEIVINTAAANEKVLNYFGSYFHVSHLQISAAEKQEMRKTLTEQISEHGYVHIKDVYDRFGKNNFALARNGVNTPYSLFSLLEYLFGRRFSFERPYITKNGIEVDKPEERIRGFISGNDVLAISEIVSYANDIHFTINSLLEFLDSLNDSYLLIDDENIASFDYIGINNSIAKDIVRIAEARIEGSMFIREIDFASNFPKLNTPWNEWLIYSIIKKWSSKLQVGVSNTQFRYAIPIIAKKNKLEIIERNREREDHGWLTIADNLNDMDDLVADILEEMEFDDI